MPTTPRPTGQLLRRPLPRPWPVPRTLSPCSATCPPIAPGCVLCRREGSTRHLQAHHRLRCAASMRWWDGRVCPWQRTRAQPVRPITLGHDRRGPLRQRLGPCEDFAGARPRAWPWSPCQAQPRAGSCGQALDYGDAALTLAFESRPIPGTVDPETPDYEMHSLDPAQRRADGLRRASLAAKELVVAVQDRRNSSSPTGTSTRTGRSTTGTPGSETPCASTTRSAMVTSDGRLGHQPGGGPGPGGVAGQPKGRG